MVAQGGGFVENDVTAYYNSLRQRMTALPELAEGDTVTMEVLRIKPDQDPRSAARRIALQILYEIEAAQHPVGIVMSVHLGVHDDLPHATVRYTRRLVRRVMEMQDELNAVIHRFAPAFPVGQIALVDRNVLRIALYELLYIPSIPIGVIVDEAVEVANHFGSEGSAAFVNGVLGTIVHDPALLHQLREQVRVEGDDVPDDNPLAGEPLDSLRMDRAGEDED
jgi:N utilization substance protein B